MKTPKSVRAALSPQRPKILGREMAAFTGCHLLALEAVASPVIRLGDRKPGMLDYATGVVLCSMKGIEAHTIAETQPEQLRRQALELCDTATPSQLLEAGVALVRHINAGLGVSPSKSSTPAAQEDGSSPDPTPATPSPASA